VHAAPSSCRHASTRYALRFIASAIRISDGVSPHHSTRWLMPLLTSHSPLLDPTPSQIPFSTRFVISRRRLHIQMSAPPALGRSPPGLISPTAYAPRRCSSSTRSPAPTHHGMRRAGPTFMRAIRADPTLTTSSPRTSASAISACPALARSDGSRAATTRTRSPQASPNRRGHLARRMPCSSRGGDGQRPRTRRGRAKVRRICRRNMSGLLSLSDEISPLGPHGTRHMPSGAPAPSDKARAGHSAEKPRINNTYVDVRQRLAAVSRARSSLFAVCAAVLCCALAFRLTFGHTVYVLYEPKRDRDTSRHAAREKQCAGSVVCGAVIRLDNVNGQAWRT